MQARENIPYIASSAASTTLERLAEAADGNGWFQLYVSSDAAVTEGLIARAEAADYNVMMVTADVPAAGKRDRDIRNQLAVPFRFTPEVMLQSPNPRWSLTSLRHGKPNIANYADLLQSATSYADVQKTLITPGFTWEDLKRLRDTLERQAAGQRYSACRQTPWPAPNLGCDGIVVSNHGGRQVAFGPPTIEALPAIAGGCRTAA